MTGWRGLVSGIHLFQPQHLRLALKIGKTGQIHRKA